MSLTNQMRNTRRSYEGLPFELSLDSFEGIQKAVRVEDKAVTKEYNKGVTDWAKSQHSGLRRSISQLIKDDIGLSASIKEKVYFNRQGGKEAERVGFSFLREGIHIHKGAGRGQGGLKGSSWITRHGEKKTRAAESAGKMNSGNRKKKEWFDTVMDKQLPQLADIVGNYSATLQVNATKLYVDR